MDSTPNGLNITKILFTNSIPSNEELFKACIEIRRKVFVIGQNVSEERDLDGLDQDSIHYLLLDGNYPVGTARVRIVDEKAKIERVAIIQEKSKKGFGTFLMTHILEDIKSNYKSKVAELGSQLYISKFYKKFGFVEEGEVFLDANIDHIYMKKIL